VRGCAERGAADVRLLVSIHDVMPATLAATRAIFERLIDAGLAPVTLLICPGTGWTPAALAELRTLTGRGAVPAGHGWCHEARAIRGFRHRLHSLLLSRRAAEHLALELNEIVDLIEANHRWFAEHDLPAPDLYVPPAWAMGPVARSTLAGLPFRYFETLAGVFDSHTGRFHRLPMAGFEADSALRAGFVAPFNALNAAWAQASGRPLRLGIHPQDFELRLAGQLRRWIRRGGHAIDYRDLGGS